MLLAVVDGRWSMSGVGCYPSLASLSHALILIFIIIGPPCLVPCRRYVELQFSPVGALLGARVRGGCGRSLMHCDSKGRPSRELVTGKGGPQLSLQCVILAGGQIVVAAYLIKRLSIISALFSLVVRNFPPLQGRTYLLQCIILVAHLEAVSPCRFARIYLSAAVW